MTESRKTNVTKTHKKHTGRSNWDEGNTCDNCNKSMNKYKINHKFHIIKKKLNSLISNHNSSCRRKEKKKTPAAQQPTNYT